MKSLCNVCKSNELRTVFKHSKIPKYNLNYYNNINKSLNSKFEKVNFVICKKCNFVFNRKYKELNYLVEYNANRSNSKVFNAYLNKISNNLFLYIKNIKSWTREELEKEYITLMKLCKNIYDSKIITINNMF